MLLLTSTFGEHVLYKAEGEGLEVEEAADVLVAVEGVGSAGQGAGGGDGAAGKAGRVARVEVDAPAGGRST